MSAFEDFVQVELPKRPYLNTDPAQETVIVRRGPGPRQLAGVVLTEGQVLGMQGGVLTGVTPSGGSSVRSYVQPFVIADVTWTIVHNLNSTSVIVQAYDDSGFQIVPNEIQVVDADTVELSFNTAQAGEARLIFLD